MNTATTPSTMTRVLLLLLAAILVAPVAPARSAEKARGQEIIVVLDAGEDPVAVAREMAVEVTHVYRHVFTGFAGIAPANVGIAALSARSGERIFDDGRVRLESQTLSTGVRRAGTPVQPGDEHLAIPSPVDVDIAILDTGVSRVADLTVAGGTSCVGLIDIKEKKGKKKRKGKKGKGKRGKKKAKRQKKQEKRAKKRNKQRSKQWADDHGHGTHTAGIAAAIDNDRDIAGVAPGARVWAVKVLDARGDGYISDVICGLDWVVKHADTIDVANMSLSASGSNGNCNSTALHRAVCSTVNAGVPVVVAAGNQSSEASTRVPAAYDQVITVSAFGDSDGLPGGLGPDTCNGKADDVFLGFSNYGPAVDIAAPGDCILSLLPDGGLAEFSGTSEATPHVAGAVANYIADYTAEHGARPSPGQSRDWLLTEAARPQDSAEGFASNRPNSDEPVLWLEALSGGS